MGQGKIIDNEFSDMEEIDTEKSLKHDYKEKIEIEKLEKKRRDGRKKIQI